MNRRNFVTVSAVTLAGAGAIIYLPWKFRHHGNGQSGQNKWTFGFSQVTTLEPWRVQFNKDMKAEAAKHPEVTLIVTDGEDRTEKQVADVENLIRQEVSVLLISPKESAGLTGVVDKAVDAGIPVIVLDRAVNTSRYTEFVGGDNVLIGKTAGDFAVTALGGAGKAKGNVVEIWGGLGAQPAHDRHDGFHSATDKESGLVYLLNQQSADWKQSQAYDIMATALRNHPKIDLVFGHNDPMAYGAYLAAKDANRHKEMLFLGIDALPEEGIRWVANGELAATVSYPTPGAEGFRQALRLMHGEHIDKKITLGTTLVTKANAAELLKANGLAA